MIEYGERGKKYFTELMRVRGWKVSEALKCWGRSYDWYHRNCNGGEFEHNRLECMCDGLPMTEEAIAENRKKFEELMFTFRVAGRPE